MTKNLVVRSPIVVVLGHVDHGKSSILEKIKDLKITSKESGGITQHIGAYEIEHNDKKITFIDTPGHEAFSAMRSRGAKIADIAILVIAGEEGIKPQTKEAILHIKEAEIPMIVAINKIDKPTADPERIKRELIAQNVLVESMGGKIPSIGTSAQTGKGIPELLEMILLISEMEDLKVDLSEKAEGVIIESNLNPGRGTVATIILQKGTLKTGEVIATSSAFGKIKSMEDFLGKKIDKGMPSVPIIITGLEDVPVVGETFNVFPTIEHAKNSIKKSSKKIFPEVKVNENQKVVNLILKADVFGSIEAIAQVLKTLPQGEDKPVLRVLRADVGEVNDSDIKQAKSSDAKIIGFRVKTNSIAKKLSLREKITVINFDIIYELAQAVRQLLEKKVGNEIVRKDLGKLKVLAIFRTEKNSQIVGGKVIEGEIKRGSKLEVFRNEEMIGKGKITKLQQDKKDVDQIGKGRECGILYQGNIQVEEGDILNIYIEESKRGEL
jgi:translation initiation factor IF-2